MVILQDVWSAIDKGYEHIANLQYRIAKKAPVTGDITAFETDEKIAVELYAYLEALEELNLNHDVVENTIIERLYNKIKILTKEIT